MATPGTDLVLSSSGALARPQEVVREQFVTVRLGTQLFGIPVLSVHDVMRQVQLTPIPLAPPYVEGAMNLRGSIVTLISLRHCLGYDPAEEGQKRMYVVVEHDQEQYSLIVDDVGEVLSLPRDEMESMPPNQEQKWRDMAAGVYRLEGEILVILHIERLFAAQ